MGSLNAFFSSQRYLLLIILAGGFLLFFRIGDRALYSKDEGRYAEIPREMVEMRDYVTPRLNYVLYFEKPALSYWLTAGSYRLFGVNEGAARFPLSALGLLTLVATFVFGRRLFGERPGFIGAMVLLMTIGFFLVSRFLVIDGPFTFFFAVSLFCFLDGWMNDRPASMRGFYVFMGLAVLTKGLIGVVLPGLIILCWAAVARERLSLRRMRIPSGAALFLLVTAPWFVAVTLKHPSFFDFFFIREHFMRYLTPIAQREEPFYYFLIVGAVFFLPWTLLIPAFVKQAWSDSDPRRRKTLAFLHCWWAVVIVFFSLSKSKLPPYILPMTPPLAMIAGVYLSDFYSQLSGMRYIRKSLLLFTAVIACLIPYILWEFVTSLKTDADAPLVFPHAIALITLFTLLAAAIAVILRIWKKTGNAPSRRLRAAPFIAFVMLFMFGYAVIILAMERMNTSQSARDLAMAIRNSSPAKSVVCAYGGYERWSDCAFYLKQRITVVGDNAGELTFGRDADPAGNKPYFISLDEFKELARRDDPVYMLIKKNGFSEISGELPPMTVLAETPKGLVITNKMD